MQIHRSLKPVFVLSSTMLIAACAAKPCQAPACGDDQSLVAEVQGLLAQHPDLGPPNIITVQAHNGVVYLHGLVATDLQKQDAEDVIKRSPRVKRVENMIGLDNSTF
ncbi:MAG TPA: BON domain-containing protein [Steroidobacteraceae bacterium]|jgi:osmotically-inducible protein OsmY